jgi:hypothetical protein
MTKQVALPALLILCPALAAAQTPRTIPAQPSMFEVLSDSQWIRVYSTGHAPLEGRLLEHSATEIVLDREPRPLRIPLTSIDTLWERRTASKTGALIGGLVGAGVGVLVATQTVEKGETPSADWVGIFAIGGATGGGLLGALAGRAFPKWQRLYTRSLSPKAIQ